jgi:hypothetical protein
VKSKSKKMSWTAEQLIEFTNNKPHWLSHEVLQSLTYPTVYSVPLSIDDKAVLVAIGCTFLPYNMMRMDGGLRYYIELPMQVPDDVPPVELSDLSDTRISTMRQLCAWFKFKDDKIRECVVMQIKNRRPFKSNLTPYEKRALAAAGYTIGGAPEFRITPPGME